MTLSELVVGSVTCKFLTPPSASVRHSGQTLAIFPNLAHARRDKLGWEASTHWKSTNGFSGIDRVIFHNSANVSLISVDMPNMGLRETDELLGFISYSTDAIFLDCESHFKKKIIIIIDCSLN